jgi:hypothetical protein
MGGMLSVGYGAEGRYEWPKGSRRTGPRDTRRLDVGSEWEREGGKEGR